MIKEDIYCCGGNVAQTDLSDIELTVKVFYVFFFLKKIWRDFG